MSSLITYGRGAVCFVVHLTAGIVAGVWVGWEDFVESWQAIKRHD